MDLRAAATSYYQQLVPQGEIYTQGHGISMHISEWDLRVPRLLPATRRRTPRDMASMYISEWDLRGAVLEKYTPRDMAFLHVSEWDLHGAAITTSLCHKGEIYTQDMAFLHMYISEWIYTVPLLLLAASQGVYTPGTWHPGRIQNGI
jgi:hypothetical protein